MSYTTPERHAVYAVCPDGLAFRIGLPVSWGRAQDRWSRLDARLRARGLTIRHDGRRWAAMRLEVRAVDAHGRGLGSERHALAFPVPYRLARVAS